MLTFTGLAGQNTCGASLDLDSNWKLIRISSITQNSSDSQDAYCLQGPAASAPVPLYFMHS